MSPIRTFVAIALLSSSAFGFCPSKSAEKKIVELYSRASEKSGYEIKNLQYVQFMNDSETVYEYMVVFDRIDGSGNQQRMLGNISIDTEDPECKILEARSHTLRDFEL